MQPLACEHARVWIVLWLCRYVNGPDADTSQGLAPGDLEAALLAGLGKAKRNQTITRLLQEGRPPPSGYALSQQTSRVVVISAPHHQGGHLWHGRKVVERILASHGPTGLQVLLFMTPVAHSTCRWSPSAHCEPLVRSRAT